MKQAQAAGSQGSFGYDNEQDNDNTDFDQALIANMNSDDESGTDDDEDLENKGQDYFSQ